VISWIDSKWRPMTGWLYILINFFDFLLAPIVAMFFGQVWVPITLQGSGIFHVSFGAILGVTSWTRGQEKLKTVPEVDEVK